MYFLYFISAFLLSVVFTYGVKRIMTYLKIVDRARTSERKIHKKTVPLGGGIGIFVSFFLVVFFALFVYGDIGIDIVPGYIWGLFIGGLILLVGGILDDKYTYKARYQIIFPILAVIIVISFGIGPREVTNPFGGVLRLDDIQIPIDGLGTWVVLADIVVFFWLMGMMFTTKFLDGLDGLVAGIVTIGALMIFFLARQVEWYQPEVALLSIIFAGACSGFLVWNWYPAKIFLGEGGSLFTGFLLGSLAIISGGKIATTLLVVGVPMLDVVRVIIRRIQKKKPFYMGDNEHLHFKLLHSGLSQKQAVLLLYTISFSFGISTLFLQSRQKMIALMFLFILMLGIGMWFSKKETGVV